MLLKSHFWYSPSQQENLLYFELDDTFLFFPADGDAAFIDRACLTEQHFFNPDRVNTAEKEEIKKHIAENVRQNDADSEAIFLTEGASTRVFIAALTAVLNDTENAIPNEDRKLFHPLRKNMAWKKNAKQNFVTHSYSFGGINFTVIPNPAPGHIGNLFLHGVGAYGEDKKVDSNSILAILATLTNKDPQKEREIAQLLKQHLREGTAFDAALFKDKKNESRWHKRMNGLLLLIGLFEITRRGFTDHSIITSKSAKEHYVPFRPFAIGLSKALDLLADGHLRMADVFGCDAPYGMSTTRELNSAQGIGKSFEKLKKIHQLYAEKYYQPALEGEALNRYEALQFRFPQGTIVPRSEKLHQELRANFGPQGTPNKPYQSRGPTPQTSPVANSKRPFKALSDITLEIENVAKKICFNNSDKTECVTTKPVLRSMSFQQLNQEKAAQTSFPNPYVKPKNSIRGFR